MELEEKGLQLRTSPGLAEKNATLGSKVERTRTATIRLQSESEAVLMVVDETRALRDQMKDVVTSVTSLGNGELELEAELR